VTGPGHVWRVLNGLIPPVDLVECAEAAAAHRNWWSAWRTSNQVTA
jgi:hypothetical protein